MNKSLEIWGGVECTVNRVGDNYFDQLSSNGHYTRLSDLDLFAEIGLKTLRYPFLWEHAAPDGLDTADWSWADLRLERLQKLGIRPIAGLVHHGSGPRYTDLLDPQFGRKLAEYARAFAERYPWVEDYTPVNEQCTTARFSGLYGFWYPHGRDFATFARCLLNECRATILSMAEIRKVNSQARLIQTDDFGRITSTPFLQYQADHENERRWLGFDLLCGRFTPSHPIWELFLKHGVLEGELHWFMENACPPDIIGINHYVLSNRHLDERLERYPVESHGGNDHHAYADVETVRVADITPALPEDLYREAWQRYGIPVCATEVHLDASREDQVRWLMQIWKGARQLQSEGVDFRAVTYWGLLGHYDWHCLVTRCEGHYESGVFDLRAAKPRPTMLAKVVTALARNGDFNHPVLDAPGWWRRADRIRFPRPVRPSEPFGPGTFEVSSSGRTSRPVLITGRRGTLGQAFARVCEERGIPYRLVSRQELDICDAAGIEKTLTEINPWAVINTAGYVRVDDAEQDYEKCWMENVTGPKALATACASRSLPFATFSSDLVFNGQTQTPYRESSLVGPLNVYGQSKAKAEQAVLSEHPEALVIRTSAFFGPWDQHNFATICIRCLEMGQDFPALADVKVSPTYVPDLAHTTLNLLLDQEYGIWNVANSGEVTWADFATEVAQRLRLDTSRIIPTRLRDLKLPARRPQYSVLGSERAVLLPSLDRGIERYLDERRHNEH